VILVLYSILLTKGADNVLNEMDHSTNTLISTHGYCSQELINLMLVGRASSNVADGDVDMGEDIVLKGVNTKSQIGFLTLFEHYGYFEVGTNLKNPKIPIFIVCSESHYSVLFGFDMDIIQKQKKAGFDLIFYDGLIRQEEQIVLSLTQKKPKQFKEEEEEIIPPIELVIRTKWKNVDIDWNGSTKIL
jgi:ubiquitin carboxyl-terminal hydrolase MINDY-3/4